MPRKVKGEPEGAAKRGRPRDPAIDAAIIEAAADVLARRGYARMTVAAVAAQAGVSEPTVYLRYGTKPDLALAAVAQIPLLADPPDSGDAFDDLTTLLRRLGAATDAAGGAMVLTGTVLAEARQHPELLEQWRTTVGGTLTGIVERIVEQGQARGQLAAGVRPDLVADLILGAHFARYSYRGRPKPGWARSVIDALRPALAP